MERKIWLKLFALLLLVPSALASHDNKAPPAGSVTPETPALPDSELAPVNPAAGSESGSSLKESGQANVSNNNTESGQSSSKNSTAEVEEIPFIPSETSIQINGTRTTSSEPLELNRTITEDTPLRPDSKNLTTPTSTSTTATKKTDTSSKPPPTTVSHLEVTGTSQPVVPVQTDKMTSKPTQSTTTTTAAAMSEIPHTTVTTPVTQSTTTSNAISTQETTQPPATTAKTTSSAHLEGLSESPRDTVSSKTHAVTPSQLNVGEDTKVEQETPTLDPLLAGLVSAFIIAAVIIALLLFLKLRRRDSRPEFRRLQDLPMDDMMEDTPLSMYSY